MPDRFSFRYCSLPLSPERYCRRSAQPGQAPRYTALVNAIAGARGMLAPFAGSALGSDGVVGTAGVLIAGAVMCLAGGGLALRDSVHPKARFGRAKATPAIT